MGHPKLRFRADVQMQLAKIGYELRQVTGAIEELTRDRPPTEAEQHVLSHATEALKGLRLAQDHAELVGFYLDEVREEAEEQ